MGYKERQRNHQTGLVGSDTFSEDGGNVEFRGKERAYILKDGYNNLYEPIRKEADLYFSKEVNNISWWGGKKPTGHILSSQIACLNHLFPIRCDDKAVKEIINHIVKINDVPIKEFDEVLKIESDEYNEECARGYIAFEAVSDKGHLNEKQHKRGSNCTSIDALIYAKDNCDKKWLILIEWKYTESYNKFDKSTEIRKTAKGYRRSGDTRMECYNNLIEKSHFLRHLSDDKKKWPANADDYKGSVYYQEPFYQLMRQTLWAEKMIEHKGEESIEADHYLHIHVVPNANEALLNKGFDGVGDTMEKTWGNCLNEDGKKRYIIIDPKDMMEPLRDNEKIDKDYSPLLEYLEKRYWAG